MVLKFNIFNENHKDIDPYDEENWDDDEFKVGDKVICINDEGTFNGHENLLIKGKEYEIVGMEICGKNFNLVLKGVYGCSWLQSRFVKNRLNEGRIFRKKSL